MCVGLRSHTPTRADWFGRGMVPPKINRVRGKTKEQRRREIGRMKKKNMKKAGKKPKAQTTKDVSRRAGSKKLPAPTKKKAKKMEQRARLAAKAAAVVVNAMDTS